MLTRRELLCTAALATLLPAFKCAPALSQTRHGFFATRTIAAAGFIYGLPLVLSYAVMYENAVNRRSGRFKAAFNHIKNESSVVTRANTTVVLPNNDTARSIAWLDLRAEPIIISVPAVSSARYYSITLRDGKFYNYGTIGSRMTGNERGDYLVVGPDWNGETPSAVKKVFRSSTQFSIALYHTQRFGPDDAENVNKLQAGYRLETLSKNGQQPTPSPVPAVKFRWIRKKHLRKNFFQSLATALQFAPAQFVEASANANLAKLGVGPGRTFDFWDLSSKEKLAITLGIRAGDRKIDGAIADADVVLSGWRIAAYFGDSDFYLGNWLLRAAAAKSNFYGLDPREAVFLFTRVDERGEELDGSKHNYTLTFEPGQMPPVNAFWSLTMYGGESKLLINNPINRYLFNSSMLPTMRTNANGGRTIYIQNRPPNVDRLANWLPAPSATMLLGLRLYWPQIEPPSILPIGKGTWQPPGLKRVS